MVFWLSCLCSGFESQADRGSEGIFLGYEEGRRAYRILDRQQTLTTKHKKENSSQRDNLEIGSPTPSESNLEPSPIENSEELISSTTKPPSLLRTDPNPDPTRLAGKSPTYDLIPENKLPPKEIIGKVGDPWNVIESQRRPKHSANAVSLLDKECPNNFHQAMKCELHQHWEDAIQKELENMEKHQVWSPATLTENTKPLSTTWVFKFKTNEEGTLTKFKARLCVQRFHQKEGIDYGDVFSPTGRLTSPQLLLTLCHLNRFTIEQMDVKWAFLNGRPEKDLYIIRPNGYKKHQPSK
ncbi:hypothetical protein O181_021311 [Austropuccinia psidii MF-1]|uniref:Reverse transcriptase Ty1/copia-type domain-containing protein n=1 Tax=Austropuccinia psidii MF-1 TaxID=1389203 RepID=A0A9Q3CF92_9BASI|nr:hypothetical protein [Austropuccinia psidii MF-1]